MLWCVLLLLYDVSQRCKKKLLFVFSVYMCLLVSMHAWISNCCVLTLHDLCVGMLFGFSAYSRLKSLRTVSVPEQFEVTSVRTAGMFPGTHACKI